MGVVTIHENGYRKFIRPPGHEGCKISTHIFDCLTFGSGRAGRQRPLGVRLRSWPAPTSSSFPTRDRAGRTPMKT